MPAAKEAPPPPAEGLPPKKSKKLLIIIIAGALILVLVLAGATVLLLKNKAGADGDEETAHETTDKKAKKKEEKRSPPVYLKVEPYTINLKGEQGDQYLRLEMSAEFDDQQAADAAKAYMPRIRHQTMQLLKGKMVSELNSKDGTQKLAKEIRDEMNLILGEPEEGQKVPPGPVKEVLFTDFVIQ
ncbi:MAG TPA: flagellar basal body-associated FliL family protein [Rhodocyclaceae bacterium]|nr:flagellar basal body-associated FliL family protein [Rhodocyclaceae bacterium]